MTLGFVSGAVVLWLARPSSTTLAVGVPIAFVGEALRVWAAGHLNKAREVTATGPYRWIAHPLYLGSTLIGVGLSVATDRAMVAAIVAVYLGVMLTAAIKSEEAFLRRAYGDRYDHYRSGASRTDRLKSGGERRFSVAQALANREHRALVGFVVVVLLLALKATYNGMF